MKLLLLSLLLFLFACGDSNQGAQQAPAPVVEEELETKKLTAVSQGALTIADDVELKLEFKIEGSESCTEGIEIVSSNPEVLAYLPDSLAKENDNCAFLVKSELDKEGVVSVNVYYDKGGENEIKIEFIVTVVKEDIDPIVTTPFGKEYVVGQPNAIINANLKSGLNKPSKVIVVGSKLIVADSAANRVLIWNSLPTSNGNEPDVVLGQSDFQSVTPNAGGISASSLNFPGGLASDGTKLLVADTSNNRVLIWNTIPTVSGQAANYVLGQANFTSNNVNAGTSVSSQTLSGPRGMSICGTNLFVADTINNRVLIWTALPTADQEAADFVIGQVNLSQNTNHTTATGARTKIPQDVYCDGTRVFVADTGHHRVLMFDAIPSADSASANRAIGQSSLGGKNFELSDDGLNSPRGVYSDGTKLYVADYNNRRLLIWNSLPASHGVAANVVLGQPDFDTGTVSNYGSEPDLLGGPSGISISSGKLFVADEYHNRVIIYNSVPTVDQPDADLVVGQGSLFSSQEFAKSSVTSTFHKPFRITSDGERVAVVDYMFNRILLWNDLKTLNTQTPDFVLGQTSLAGVTHNSGGVSASTLFYPSDAIFIGDKFVVADYLNNRVLIWNSLSGTSGQAADIVLGQADFVSNSQPGSPTSANLANPYALASDGNKLFVADQSHHRVLIWNSIPTANNTAANTVLGQSNMTSAVALAASQSSIRSPLGLAFSNGKLIVSSETHNRVMIWNSIPVIDNTAADVVLGQPDFTGFTGNNGGLSGASLDRPWGVHVSERGRLYIADYDNNRILYWNSIPTSNGESADGVFGQPDFTTNTENTGGLSKNSLFEPYSIGSFKDQLWLLDGGNSRILGQVETVE